ncbi:MAG TPA: FtsQ-type POTRA domain-containing protein [Candidatus Udaeobacter sp.]|nr:FtsQ-type POTRA domain-containing protein [Candidatus Udaeobacter sp.]
MTPLYQGRALRDAGATGRRPRSGIGASVTGGKGTGRAPGLGRLIRRVVAVALGLMILGSLPWSLPGLRALARRWAVVTNLRVDGLHYLESGHVIKAAGLAIGQPLFHLHLDRARQALLLEPRIAAVELERLWPRGIAIHVQERTPVLLVEHGEPWEIDSAGVLLPPLQAGVEADVPLVAGPRFDRWPAGARVRTAEIDRALAWVRALSDRDLQLGAQLSEVDVSEPRTTGLTLLTGTRVMCPAWPPDRRTLSALRVVLADLKQRGTLAQEVDMRFESQIIVRPVEAARAQGLGPASPPAARRS